MTYDDSFAQANYSLHQDDLASIKRGTYRSDEQRALSDISTLALEEAARTLNAGTIDDRRYLTFELLPILEGRWS